MDAELKNVTEALEALTGDGRFAVELACPSDDLHITVDGVGPLEFPISAAAARSVCAVAQPSPFGRRGRTLYDRRVRDSWEIGRSQVHIDAQAWKRTLDAQLATVRDGLGLSKAGKLRAVFDKMLVYGRGQFFAPHQDSERAGDMVGTLVVELPSRHTGGATVVAHRGRKRVFSGATRGSKELSLLAFYADCHHEAQPVESGYRIVLTYRLHHSGGPSVEAPTDLAPHVDRLAAAVAAYFDAPKAARYGTTSQSAPRERLVYLLDHEYTQKSLGWERLKNADRIRAGALRQVAERLDCEVFLALADVHESWSCDGPEDYGSWGHDEYDDDDGDDGEERDDAADRDDYELIDLCDSDVELRHWIGPRGKGDPGAPSSVSDDEICYTLASVEMKPFKSEYEGYMGNYGNTMDRWYHRAAVVMWPRARSFVVRAQVSPSWAVDEIAKLVAAGENEDARAKAASLLPFWQQVASGDHGETFFRKLCAPLASLNDAELAYALLSPFGPDRLTARATPAFTGLVERYGLSWSQRLFSKWAERHHFGAPHWLASLPRLCESFAAIGEVPGGAVARWLLAREAASFQAHQGNLRRAAAWEKAPGNRGWIEESLALFDAARVIDAADIRDALVTSFTHSATGLSLLQLGELLRAFRDGRTPAQVRALGLHALYEHVLAGLERTVDAPPRRPDDWSIEPPGDCSCDLCRELAEFLRAPDRIEHRWPLAKERRRHLHDIIDGSRLPVSHETLRVGRPQTLVLQKQPALFERERKVRERQQALLSWLRRERAAFSTDA